jgi:hypothetical protein
MYTGRIKEIHTPRIKENKETKKFKQFIFIFYFLINSKKLTGRILWLHHNQVVEVIKAIIY